MQEVIMRLADSMLPAQRGRRVILRNRPIFAISDWLIRQSRVHSMVRRIEAQVQSDDLVFSRREQIINAAIAVFHRRGFHVATTADIAEQAGLTQSNLYNYIRSKQDVLLMVCSHLVGVYNKIFDDIADKHDDPHECCVEVLAAIIEAMGWESTSSKFNFSITRLTRWRSAIEWQCWLQYPASSEGLRHCCAVTRRSTGSWNCGTGAWRPIFCRLSRR
jgi:hypothetical protein